MGVDLELPFWGNHYIVALCDVGREGVWYVPRMPLESAHRLVHRGGLLLFERFSGDLCETTFLPIMT